MSNESVKKAMADATLKLKEAMRETSVKTASRNEFVSEHPEDASPSERLEQMLRPHINEIKTANDKREGIEPEVSLEVHSEGETADLVDDNDKEAHDRPDGARGPDTNDKAGDHVSDQVGPGASTEVAPTVKAAELWELLSSNPFVQAGFEAGLQKKQAMISDLSMQLMSIEARK